MHSSMSTPHENQQYVVVSPEGNQIVITKELFGALMDFMQGINKPTGSLVIQFRNGGIAGLEGTIKKIYK